jgi:hypothetical protein
MKGFSFALSVIVWRLKKKRVNIAVIAAGGFRIREEDTAVIVV